MTRKMQFHVGLNRIGLAKEVDTESRTVHLVFSTGARVSRMTWDGERYDEDLLIGTDNVRMGRLNGGANLLDSHASWSLDRVLGVVERAWIDDGEAKATVRFSDRAQVEPIWRDVQGGIIRQVSVGYLWHRVERVRGGGTDGVDLYRVVDWEPTEISLVAVPADPGAGIRAENHELTTRHAYTITDMAPTTTPGGDTARRLAWMERLRRHSAAKERSN